LIDVFDGSEDLADGMGEFVPMNIQSYRKVVKPLFLKSTEVHFVDAYFKLRNGANRDIFKWRVLEGLFEEAKNSMRCNLFFFHLDKNTFTNERERDDFIEDVQQIKENIGFKNLSISYSEDTSQHGRYIFSNYGGLKFDQGFGTSGDPSAVIDIQWINPKLLNELLEKYERPYL
jgi:hypothetical protein